MVTIYLISDYGLSIAFTANRKAEAASSQSFIFKYLILNFFIKSGKWMQIVITSASGILPHQIGKDTNMQLLRG